MNIIPLSQTDKMWSDRKLGTSQLTIGEAGCLITCVSMLLQHYDIDILPNELNAVLTFCDGYEDGNLMKWYTVAKVFGLKIDSIVNCPFIPAPIQDISNWLSCNKKVICKVDASSEPGIQSHFILLIDPGFTYIDPYDGKIKRMNNPEKDILFAIAYSK